MNQGIPYGGQAAVGDTLVHLLKSISRDHLQGSDILCG
jgi:hypothetical protein